MQSRAIRCNSRWAAYSATTPRGREFWAQTVIVCPETLVAGFALDSRLLRQGVTTLRVSTLTVLIAMLGAVAGCGDTSSPSAPAPVAPTVPPAPPPSPRPTATVVIEQG